MLAAVAFVAGGIGAVRFAVFTSRQPVCNQPARPAVAVMADYAELPMAAG